jgi:hypothetical protein
MTTAAVPPINVPMKRYKAFDRIAPVSGWATI